MQNKNSKRIVSGAGIFIFFLSFFWCFFFVGTANAASLDFSTTTNNYIKGDELLVNINVSSLDQSINAAYGSISFPTDKLEVVSISKENSIFTFWIREPSFSNTASNINFQGIIFNPGFMGENGKIMTIKFKVKNGGNANLNLSSGSVLVNNGKGTSIPTTLGSKQFNLE